MGNSNQCKSGKTTMQDRLTTVHNTPIPYPQDVRDNLEAMAELQDKGYVSLTPIAESFMASVRSTTPSPTFSVSYGECNDSCMSMVGCTCMIKEEVLDKTPSPRLQLLVDIAEAGEG